MPAERERTFLVAKLPDLKGVKHAEIEQYYFTKEKGGMRMRKTVSKDGAKIEMTKKLPIAGDAKDRNELDPLPVSEEEFELFKTVSGRHLKKRRHYLPLPDGLIAELDVYKDKLKGHFSIDVEFPSAAAKAAFVPPPWFGREITNERFGSNAFLAGKTYKEIKPLIDSVASKK